MEIPFSNVDNPAMQIRTFIALLALAAILLTIGERARPVSAAGAVGALAIASDPSGAAIYVDGRFVGQTPLTLLTLTDGDHRVRLVRGGYLEHSRIVRVHGSRTVTFNARLTVRAAGAQAAAITIVVIAGEDAVNIIQQKTAVTPIVEVRDRNDLPVPGAVVTFTIGGGKTAAFAGGSQTLTVTTNAAGRAAAAALTPLSNGGVQIQVSAAFQGQTATAIISQVNVATAAQAAGAGTAGGAGAGGGGAVTGAGAAAGAGAVAGGGGGLSGIAIGAIAAAAGSGAIVAAKTLSGPTGSGPTQTADVAGTWVGRAPDGWITFDIDSNGNCGRDVNDLQLVLTQTGSSIAGTITWTIRESFYPPDIGKTNTQSLTGTVNGNAVTFSFGPNPKTGSLLVASATFTSTRMTGTVTGSCQPMPFAVNRQ